MNILVDTRQHEGKHTLKHSQIADYGHRCLRSKLPFGDYALIPSRAVDTKADIYELSMDIDQEHQRFKRELLNAREYGCKLYILVENTDGVRSLSDLAGWSEDYNHFMMRLAKSPKARRIEGLRLAKACKTMNERYGAVFLFCAPEEAGQKILEILQWDG